MNPSKNILIAVLAFGGLFLAIAIFLIQVRPATAPLEQFRPTSPEQLYGIWNTRTLAEDNLNGAYSGQLRFGPDYYEVRNDIVVNPIRMDAVNYRIRGSQIELWLEGNAATPTIIELLSPDRATIRFAAASGSVLYMYKQPR